MVKNIIVGTLSLLLGFTLSVTLTNRDKINEQNNSIEQLTQEIMVLKDEIYDLQEQLN